jgi:methionine aminopeptidase type I
VFKTLRNIATPRKNMGIILKSKEEVDKMRVAGQLAAEVLQMIRPHVQPGVTTGELDDICHEYITKTQQAIPAPLDYRGFPRSICTSVNHVILKDGDIVNIDITVIKDGWHGDTSKMFLVGKPTIKGKRICDIAHRSMVTGIETVRPGVRLGDIGHAIQGGFSRRPAGLALWPAGNQGSSGARNGVHH